MSLLRYTAPGDADPVQLEICLLDIQERAVYTDDGADYLFTHFLITLQCYVNEQATGNAAPAAAIPALRSKLMQNRGHLQIIVGSQLILESPLTVVPNALAQCDANNGPHPISFNLIELDGFTTAICVYQLETWLVDVGKHAGSLIGHRWRMSVDYDDQFMATRTVDGYAIFRKDFLINNQRVPDDFRQYLLHPIPDNFLRKPPSVSVDEAGCRVDYKIVDEEQWLNLGQENPVVKIKGSISNGFNAQGGWLTGALLGQQFKTFRVQAWGTRESTRVQLIKACGQAAASYAFLNMDPTAQSKNIMGTRAVTSFDIIEKYAEMEINVMVAGGAKFAGFFGLDIVNPDTQVREGLPPVASAADGPNPRLIGKSAYGSSLLEVIAQALTNPGTNPAQATAVPSARFSIPPP